MTSNCRPLYYNNATQYPYVDKLSFRGTDIEDAEMDVDFIYQFVKNSYSYQGDTVDYCNKFYTTNIIGPPEGHYFHKYVKQTFNECFQAIYSWHVIQTSLAPKSTHSIMQNETNIDQSFINIEYHEAVYPVRITMYAISKPENITRIWAQDSDNYWFLLWNNSWGGLPKSQQILFSPPLKACNFKTKTLRLEFNHRLWAEYFTKLDAVMLIGTSELILPRNPKQSLNNLLEGIRLDVTVKAHHSLTQFDTYATDLPPGHTSVHLDIYLLQKKLREYCIICKSNVVENFYKSQLGHKKVSQEIIADYMESLKQGYNGCFSIKDYSNYDKFIEELKILWDESEESSDSFSKLPDEIILKIFKDLDLRSLCCVGRVNKWLNNLSRDPSLYTSLNMRNIHFTYWRSDLLHILDYFTLRCEHLSQLDLSFCDFLVWKFNVFLTTCGTLLTHLRLNCCQSIDDSALLQISKTCQILKELDLTNCNLVNDEGFSHLKSLHCLERLNLQEIKNIQTETVCKILQKNRQMRDLNLAFTYLRLNIDVITIELKNSCPNLERINLFSTNTSTSKSIDALADCKNLREVNFGFINKKRVNVEDLQKSFHRLFSSQRLEKLDLSCAREFIDNHILESLILCKNLKSLKLVGVQSMTPDLCSKIFQCPKLEEIDLSYIRCFNDNLIKQWVERYQHIRIYRYHTEFAQAFSRILSAQASASIPGNNH
ncbi:uncharacterized protein LOC105835575 [Monomorium pharaonis]|uniref:uncharacterized protein LOC105835575 n=1 Tax=Monomorium pharaonis TaxID=307658 RepID=UPI0017463C2D|nr:uncharacterized protein LOC105835575 [Monomorium pharaonis]